MNRRRIAGKHSTRRAARKTQGMLAHPLAFACCLLRKTNYFFFAAFFAAFFGAAFFFVAAFLVAICLFSLSRNE